MVDAHTFQLINEGKRLSSSPFYTQWKELFLLHQYRTGVTVWHSVDASLQVAEKVGPR